MNEPTESISVEVLQNYSEADAAMLGTLLPYLTSRFDGSPASEKLITNITGSPSHDLFVARLQDGTIVGIASLSMVLGISSDKSAYLEDFVISPDHRGQGIADLLWTHLLDWCKQRGIAKLIFTSKPEKVAAHGFYLKHGARIRDTNAFVKVIE